MAHFFEIIFLHHYMDITNFICNGQRVFDAIVEGKKVMLEVKTSKNELILIPWDDVVIQVDAVKDMNLINRSYLIVLHYVRNCKRSYLY